MNNIINLFDDMHPDLEMVFARHIHVKGIVCPTCGVQVDEPDSTSDYKGRTAAAKAKLERWNKAVVGRAQE